MYKQEIQITAADGIHTRPSAKIVELAKIFSSDITITSNNKEASAKRIFSLQKLDLSKGAILTICSEGEDEKEAVDSLVNLIKSFE